MAERTVRFTCPTCKATSGDVHDGRFGYCWSCHDFTGEPTEFVFMTDPMFTERVADRMRYRIATEPIRVLTDEEHATIFEANREALDREWSIEWRLMERYGMTVARPESFALVEGQTPVVVTRRQRLRALWHRAAYRLGWWLRRFRRPDGR